MGSIFLYLDLGEKGDATLYGEHLPLPRPKLAFGVSTSTNDNDYPSGSRHEIALQSTRYSLLALQGRIQSKLYHEKLFGMHDHGSLRDKTCLHILFWLASA